MIVLTPPVMGTLQGLVTSTRLRRATWCDRRRRENVTDGRRDSRGPVRGAPVPPGRGGVPDARLAQRGGRRRPGGVAAAAPLGHQRRREPARLADHGGGAG